ncbi:MAG TPA: RidA family protein [Caulobacteraceae bacterium]|jgi:enamine deaminase RidA (YjgF/YER057c/UK114 family)|nr:RidA family protein [Caulobacteraceae bacterium]
MSKVEYVTREAMKPLIEPFGLSEAVRVGQMLYLAGQTGMDETHRIVEGGLKAQARQAFRNIKAVIELAGGATEDLVHLTWYLADGPAARSFMEDATEVLAAKEEVLPGIRPGSTAVRVKELLTPEILIEIRATCAL